jgi:hypothetical protein
MDNVTFSTLTAETKIGILNPSIPYIETLPQIAGEWDLLHYDISVDKNNTLNISYNGLVEVMVSSSNPFYLCVVYNGDRFNVPIPPNYKVNLEPIDSAVLKASRSFTHALKVCSID